MPELFRGQLELMGKCTSHEERVVFVNAWNEWAEAMDLEPDVKHGHDDLKSVARVLEDVEGSLEPAVVTAIP